MKRFIILGIVVVVVVLAWTAGWFYVAGEARKTIVALGEDNGSGAPTLNCGRLDIAGYPFRLDITCAEAAIAQEDLTATLAEVRATVLVYRLNQVLLFAKAPLMLEDAFSGAESRLTWASLESSLRLVDWRIARFSLVAENLNWADTLASEALIANAGHLELHLVDVPERLDRMARTAVLAVVGRLTGLTAPMLGVTAADTELNAEVSGLPDELIGYADPGLLRRWQAAGGALKLIGLKGTDSANFIDVTGDVKLNATGQPDGQVVIKSRGFVERFQDAIAPELRPLVIGNPDAEGSYTQTLTMTGGVVLSGLLPAGIIPPLW